MAKSFKAISVLIAVVTIVLCTIVPAAAYTVNSSAFAGTPNWYYLDVSNPQQKRYRYFGTSQLSESDLNGNIISLRVDRSFNRSDVSVMDDFLQFDMYMTASAANPSIPESLQAHSPISLYYWSTRFVGANNVGSGPYFSYYETIQPISRSFTATSNSISVSFLVSKTDFLNHLHTSGDYNNVSFMFHIYESYLNLLTSSNILQFFVIRSSVTDQLEQDQEMLMYIDLISSQINSGLISLEEGQQAIEAAIENETLAIEALQQQQHEDMEALKDEIADQFEYNREVEKSEVQDAYDDAVASIDGWDDAPVNNGLLSSLQSLYGSLTYTGTDFRFVFPASGDVPFVGSLWDAKEIPVKYFIDSLPIPLLWALRLVIILPCVLVILWCIRKLIRVIGGDY